MIQLISDTNMFTGLIMMISESCVKYIKVLIQYIYCGVSLFHNLHGKHFNDNEYILTVYFHLFHTMTKFSLN